MRDHQFIVIWVKFNVAVCHIGSRGCLPGEEGGAVELERQECGKEWLGPAEPDPLDI
jgi:hypothetical protein